MAFLAGVLSWLFNQNRIVQSFTISSKSIHQHSLSIIVGSWPCHYMYMLIISRKFDMCTVISIVIIINLLSSYPVATCASVQWQYTSSLLSAVSPHWANAGFGSKRCCYYYYRTIKKTETVH